MPDFWAAYAGDGLARSAWTNWGNRAIELQLPWLKTAWYLAFGAIGVFTQTRQTWLGWALLGCMAVALLKYFSIRGVGISG